MVFNLFQAGLFLSTARPNSSLYLSLLMRKVSQFEMLKLYFDLACMSPLFRCYFLSFGLNKTGYLVKLGKLEYIFVQHFCNQPRKRFVICCLKYSFLSILAGLELFSQLIIFCLRLAHSWSSQQLQCQHSKIEYNVFCLLCSNQRGLRKFMALGRSYLVLYFVEIYMIAINCFSVDEKWLEMNQFHSTSMYECPFRQKIKSWHTRFQKAEMLKQIIKQNIKVLFGKRCQLFCVVKRWTCRSFIDYVELSLAFENFNHFREHLSLLGELHVFVFQDLIPAQFFIFEPFKQNQLTCFSAYASIKGALLILGNFNKLFIFVQHRLFYCFISLTIDCIYYDFIVFLPYLNS